MAKKSTIEELMKKYDTSKVENAALAAAIKQQQEENAKKQAKQLIEHLNHIDSIMEESVNALRNLRKTEQKAKAKVLAIDAAREQFLKDGDWEKFTEAYHKARSLMY